MMRLLGLLVLLLTVGCSGASKSTREERAPQPMASKTTALPATSAGEEVWIISTPETRGTTPPLWAARLVTAAGAEAAPEATAIYVKITGAVARTEVKQRFAGLRGPAAEVSYFLPLPPGATPTDLVITLGQRKIRGVVRERRQAERIYTAARAQGLPATLMQASDLLALRIANVSADTPLKTVVTFAEFLRCGPHGWEHRVPLAAPANTLPPAGPVDVAVDIHNFPALRGLHFSQQGGLAGAANELRFQSTLTAPPQDLVLSYEASEKSNDVSYSDARGSYVVRQRQSPRPGVEIARISKPGAAAVLQGDACAAALWARCALQACKTPAERRKLALEYGLLTEETGMLAVDTAER